MYICICKAISKKDLEIMIRHERGDSLDGLQQKCGVGGECGTCCRRVESLVNQINQEITADEESETPVSDKKTGVGA